MLSILCWVLQGFQIVLVSGRSETSPSGGEIKILGPPSLKDHYKPTNGRISAMPALFGIPVYNGNFVGILKIWPDHIDVCEKVPENYFQSDPMDEKTKAIALVERGTCTFVQKVKNCQEAGAKGVVVFNNAMDSLPLMSDDGTGDSVSIPSIIISSLDGAILKSNVQDDSGLDVEIEISWGLPRPDGRVEWELWTSCDMTSREKQFIADFKDVVKSLEDKHLFTPHYQISSGMMEASDSDCSNDRKYCMFGNEGVPGHQLLKETLLQLCVSKTGLSINDTLLWWDYVQIFNRDCAIDSTNWDGICSVAVLQELARKKGRTSIVETIKKCVFDSGGLDGPANELFDDEIDWFSQYGVHWIPAVTINNEMYSGNMLCPNPVDMATCSIFAAICAGFSPETIPTVCVEHREIGCPSRQNRDVCGVCGGDGRSCSTSAAKSIAAGFIVIIMLVIILACGIALYFKRRLSRADAQFDALRNMYEPLRDHDNSDTKAKANLQI